MPESARVTSWGTLSAVAVAVSVVAAVDVTVDVDKQYDFGAVRTWTWSTDGPGHVRMARTQLDDPEAVRQQAEPLIIAAVAEELGRRGLQQAPGAADVTVTYFLLLSTSASAQTVGQFVPSATEWALPPLTRGTQSLKLLNRGSLVLDASANGAVVWRGVANANIKVDADTKQREALLREAVRDLVRRFPRDRR